jgi:hypothetical protein
MFGQKEGIVSQINKGTDDECEYACGNVSAIDNLSELPLGSRVIWRRDFAPRKNKKHTLQFSSINRNQTESIVVASTGVLLEIDNGVSNLCTNFAGSVSNRKGNVFRLGHWLNVLCSAGLKEGFSCTGCGEAVDPWHVQEAITFISWGNIMFSHITFDTMPKLNFTCGFMAHRPNVKVLVHNRLQEELIRLGCEGYGHVILKSRFIRHPIGRPVTADKLYFPFFLVDESPNIQYQKHIGVSGEPVRSRSKK